MSAAVNVVPPRPIREIALQLGLRESELIPYGNHIAKIDARAILARLASRANGAYVAVTGMTPTPLGEGKTLITIGLSMALNAIGRRTVGTIRQPALGPVFGIKGGASGSGASQVIPSDRINLHLTGDHHAVSAAHNLVSAIIDSRLVQGNPDGLEPTDVTWPRVLELNDRALRHVITGLGGAEHGRPRETRFDITETSEVMSILSLSTDLADLKRRLAAVTVGRSGNGQPVTVGSIGVTGALAALLREAIHPNLLQTSEHTPMLLHTGPFANISHGNSSVIADLAALKLADYVVTEAGFGADLGLEKLIHIKGRASGVYPDVAVLVCTVRALKLHSGHYHHPATRALDPTIVRENVEAVRAGAANLRRHVQNVDRLGLPVIVAINRFASDTEAELRLARELALEAGAMDACISNPWAEGSTGAAALAHSVAAAADGRASKATRPLFPADALITEKIHAIATQLYGARSVHFTPRADRQIRTYADQGLDRLPICMAKTPLSLTDDPHILGAPTDFPITVQEVRAFTGAGYVVALCGDITTMPGLPRAAAAYEIDVDEDGRITGLV